MKESISVSDSLVLKGTQVVIPKELQTSILKTTSYTSSRSRKNKTTSNRVCLLASNEQRYWWYDQNVSNMSKIHASTTTINNDFTWHTNKAMGHCWYWSFLIQQLYLFDYCRLLQQVSIYSQTSKSFSKQSDKLKEIFSENGIPNTVMSDNGSHFSSAEFKLFVNEWQFRSITSSPRRAQSNGFIERTIRTIKHVLKYHEFLLNINI